MTDQFWPVIAIPLLTAATVLAVYFIVVARRNPRRRWSSHRRSAVVEVAEAPDETRIYVALGKERLDQLYQQTPAAAFTQEREEEVGTTASGGAGFASLKASLGRTATSRERTVPNEVSAPQKAVAVERRALSDERTRSFDLISPGDEKPIKGLLTTLRGEAYRIGLTVPQVVTRELEKAWQEKSRAVPAPDLRSLGLLVRVRAEFSLQHGAPEGDYKLIASVWHRGARSASVMVLIRQDDLVPPYNNPDEVVRLGGMIRATCLGQQRWLEESDTLELRPICVYLS